MHTDISQEPFVWKFARKMAEDTSAASVLCEPAQSKCTWTFHTSHFVWKFTGEMPDASPATSVLREPAQSKWTWTVHKSHFVWKFTGEIPVASPAQRFVRACTIEMDMDCVEISRENAGRVCRDTRFVRAWAIDMHMDILQELFCGNLQGIGRTRMIPPRLNTGP
jgi:hypothetical protein